MNEGFVQKIIDLAKDHCRNRVGLDIGANHGIYTKELAKTCKRVYAFEPQMKNFRLMMEKVSDDNVIFCNMAVGNYSGEAKLHICEPNEGGHTMSSRVYSNPIYSHSPDVYEYVHVVDLDSFFPNEVNVGFMKIDVEAYEEEVLKGADKFLLNNRLIIALETHQTINRDDIYSYLCEHGYSIFDEALQPIVAASKFKSDEHYLVHNLGNEFQL